MGNNNYEISKYCTDLLKAIIDNVIRRNKFIGEKVVINFKTENLSLGAIPIVELGEETVTLIMDVLNQKEEIPNHFVMKYLPLFSHITIHWDMCIASFNGMKWAIKDFIPFLNEFSMETNDGILLDYDKAMLTVINHETKETAINIWKYKNPDLATNIPSFMLKKICKTTFERCENRGDYSDFESIFCETVNLCIDFYKKAKKLQISL